MDFCCCSPQHICYICFEIKKEQANNGICILCGVELVIQNSDNKNIIKIDHLLCKNCLVFALYYYDILDIKSFMDRFMWDQKLCPCCKWFPINLFMCTRCENILSLFYNPANQSFLKHKPRILPLIEERNNICRCGYCNYCTSKIRKQIRTKICIRCQIHQTSQTYLCDKCLSTIRIAPHNYHSPCAYCDDDKYKFGCLCDKCELKLIYANLYITSSQTTNNNSSFNYSNNNTPHSPHYNKLTSKMVPNINTINIEEFKTSPIDKISQMPSNYQVLQQCLSTPISTNHPPVQIQIP
jgi:hypothetical protein